MLNKGKTAILEYINKSNPLDLKVLRDAVKANDTLSDEDVIMLIGEIASEVEVEIRDFIEVEDAIQKSLLRKVAYEIMLANRQKTPDNYSIDKFVISQRSELTLNDMVSCIIMTENRVGGNVALATSTEFDPLSIGVTLTNLNNFRHQLTTLVSRKAHALSQTMVDRIDIVLWRVLKASYDEKLNEAMEPIDVKVAAVKEQYPEERF